MARLNIEGKFWDEILDVVAATGDQDKAIGNAVRFFKFAQQNHKDGKFFITEEEFASRGFHEKLIPNFAKRTPSGIQANGAEKYFGWLEQKKEAGKAGGRVSATRKRDEKGRLLPKQVQAKPSVHQPSSSSSSYKEKKNTSASPSESVLAVWEKYPKRKGDNPKARACEILGKLSESELAMCAVAVENFKTHHVTEKTIGTSYVPMMTTWLNQKRWLDWITPTASNPATISVRPGDRDENGFLTPEAIERLGRGIA